MSERTIDIMQRGLKKRYRAEFRFRTYGILATLVAVLFLLILFTSIVRDGYPAFQQTRIQLNIFFDSEKIADNSSDTAVADANGDYTALLKSALLETFPEVSGRKDKRKLYKLVSSGAAFELRDMALANSSLIDTTKSIWLLADDDVDVYVKSKNDEQVSGRLNAKQKAWVDQLIEAGNIKQSFNSTFFTSGDSREPEMAGVMGALVGSFYMLLVTLALSFPIGVAAALYLEEFAPRNRWTDIIEVNINNLAAVPSIVFGLLGLAVFINFFGLPRSAPVVGGLVLTLMTLPTIIIASRASLQSVPPSIREAALGIGASRVQMVFHHVLPLALPGMLTGTIIGMSRALGETAPLLMIGMVAFIVDIPSSAYDPATALPVQIYLWADSPERAFVERTSAAIIVLLGFLLVVNGLAIYLRRKFERRW